MRRIRVVGVVALLSVAALAVGGCSSSGSPVPSPAATVLATSGPSWPGYHDDNARAGAVAAEPGLDHLATAWSTALQGEVHSEPVADDGRIIVADESNHVTALNPANGDVLWSKYLGPPLTNVVGTAGCGNIDPLGITSTPVIDTSTHTVYVVGEVSLGGAKVEHRLEGLDVLTGRVLLSESVDPWLPGGETAVHLLQRASLALANGRVYVSYGGNSGDCGNYHGWVVGVREKGSPDRVSFEVAWDGEGGAIWQSGGAPAIDPHGDLYVTSGNANPDPPRGGPDPKKYTESVIKLSPNLVPLASFKDKIAGGDEDLSTGNPVLLPGGVVFSVGKTDVGYLLRQSNLSLVGKVGGVCGSDPDGGPAYDATLKVIFVPCKAGGIQEISVNSPTHPRLVRRLAVANSAPILVGQRLWALHYTDGTLTEFSAVSGTVVQTVSVGEQVAHFATPTAVYGLMLVGTNAGVTAFTAAQ